MTQNPEPAVGQVWWFKDEPHPCIIEEMICFGTVAVVVYLGIYELYDKSDWSFSDATYLGTLDELREHQALRAEVERYRSHVGTDNSAVIANLEAENAKLRALVCDVATAGNFYHHATAKDEHGVFNDLLIVLRQHVFDRCLEVKKEVLRNQPLFSHDPRNLEN